MKLSKMSRYADALAASTDTHARTLQDKEHLSSPKVELQSKLCLVLGTMGKH